MKSRNGRTRPARVNQVAERVADGRSPRMVRVRHEGDVRDALERLDVRRGRPVVVFVGGADGMDDGALRALDLVLRKAVLPAVVDVGAVVVDGGTDSGVMRGVGRARAAVGAGFVLVGVAAEGTVRLSGTGTSPIEGAADLERNHSHVVLVPGRSWGSESSWIGLVADAIAADARSITVLVNGGEIAVDDVARSLERGRPVVVLAGTGRAADAIATAGRTSDVDPRVAWIAGSKLITIVPVQDVDAVRGLLAAALT